MIKISVGWLMDILTRKPKWNHGSSYAAYFA
jgi:hypothetical protein